MDSQNLLQSLGYILGLPAFARVSVSESSQLLVCEEFHGELEEVPQSHFQMKCSLVSVHPNKQIGRQDLCVSWSNCQERGSEERPNSSLSVAMQPIRTICTPSAAQTDKGLQMERL